MAPHTKTRSDNEQYIPPQLGVKTQNESFFDEIQFKVLHVWSGCVRLGLSRLVGGYRGTPRWSTGPTIATTEPGGLGEIFMEALI